MVGLRATLSALVASTTVSGFLLPPSMTGDDDTSSYAKAIDGLDIYNMDPTLTSRLIRAPLPQGKDYEGERMDLIFNLTAAGSDHSHLELNGVPFLRDSDRHTVQAIDAAILPAAHEDPSTFEGLDRLKLDLHGPILVQRIGGSGGIAEARSLAFGLTALAPTPGVAKAEWNGAVQVLEDSEGRLGMTRAVILDPHFDLMEDAEPEDGPPAQKECTARFKVLCRLRAVIAVRIYRIKAAFRHGVHGRPGCGGLRKVIPTHPASAEETHDDEKPTKLPTHIVIDLPSVQHDVDDTTTDMPQDDAPATKFDPHGRLHRLFAHVPALVRYVFVPIVVGLVVGLLAYAIGVAVGLVAVFVWLRFFRGGRRGGAYARVAAEEDGEEIVAVEQGWTSDEKMPVEAPPMYAEVEKEVVSEQD